MAKIDIHQGDSAQKLTELLENHYRWGYCLTSPPYFGLCDYDHTGQLGHEASSEEYLDKLAHIFGLIRLGMMEQGVLFLNIGDTRNNYSTIKPRGRRGPVSYRRQPEGKETTLMNIPFRLLERLKQQGWLHHQIYIWSRACSSQPRDGRAQDTHEYIFVLGNSHSRRPDLAYTPLNSSVIFARPDSTDFPCKMPLGLAENLLKQATRPKEPVIDPFMGSGTTAIAAHNVGFANCYGIDLDISASIEATKFLQGTIFAATH